MFLDWQDWFASGRAKLPELEVISRIPRRRVTPVPVLFVHGAFTGAWCWDIHFLDGFAARGYECHALSLRGHGRSRGKRSLQHFTLNDYVDDIARVVDGLERTPVLVGHSMGGFLIQRYLERAPAEAAVLLASVPPGGLMESSLRLIMQDPMLLGQLMMLHHLGPGVVDHHIARRALFSDEIPAHELALVAANMQPESQRAIWELHAGPLPCRWRMAETPMLVLGAGRDSLIAPESVRATGRYFGVPAHLEAGMGHAMMLEPGWESVVERTADFLAEVIDD
jgi:pimeloyl-ACP methyl ester carboxylesterase